MTLSNPAELLPAAWLATASEYTENCTCRIKYKKTAGDNRTPADRPLKIKKPIFLSKAPNCIQNQIRYLTFSGVVLHSFIKYCPGWISISKAVHQACTIIINCLSQIHFMVWYVKQSSFRRKKMIRSAQRVAFRFYWYFNSAGGTLMSFHFRTDGSISFNSIFLLNLSRLCFL